MPSPVSPSQIGDTQRYSPSPNPSPSPLSFSREGSSFAVVPFSREPSLSPKDLNDQVPDPQLGTPRRPASRDLYVLNGPNPRQVPVTRQDQIAQLTRGEEDSSQS